MRKLWLSAAVALLAVVAVPVAIAIAAGTQVNTYTVDGSTKGGKGATKKKPKPVSLNFDYTVGEQSGLRPAPITNYSILFSGGQANTSAFKGCDIDKLNDPSGPGVKACPSASVMGGGQVINEVGPSEDIANKSLYCYLKLTTINSTKKNHFLLYLEGSPSASPDPKKQCVTDVHQAIDATFKKESKGTSLNFTVPPNLLHPGGVGVLDNAVVNVTSTIKRVTTKKKGKTIGFFEGYSCKKTQDISVTFTLENDGSKQTAKHTYPCKN